MRSENYEAWILCNTKKNIFKIRSKLPLLNESNSLEHFCRQPSSLAYATRNDPRRIMQAWFLVLRGVCGTRCSYSAPNPIRPSSALPTYGTFPSVLSQWLESNMSPWRVSGRRYRVTRWLIALYGLEYIIKLLTDCLLVALADKYQYRTS